MAYAWTKELETGNPTIDHQHKDLIDAINHLLDACAQGHGRAEVEKTLTFLENYISRHFADEEALQIKSKYPDYQNHKRYHEGFKQSVKGVVAEFHANGPSVTLVGQVNQVIAAWLISHIKREDVKVAAHLKAAGM